MTVPENAGYARFVSPNGFDGAGPVPEKVVTAARRIAQLRVKFLTEPDTEFTPLTSQEIDALFDAAAIQAEWMRELLDNRDKP